jgi:hypothetical protein
MDRSGRSMNVAIEKGPNRLNDLFAILLHFRRYHYTCIADVSEMFLRIRLTESDKRYHRFWWSNNFWQWNRILFGNRASPDISQNTHTHIHIHTTRCNAECRFSECHYAECRYDESNGAPLFYTIIKKYVVPLIPGLAPHSVDLVTVLVPEMKRNKLDRFPKKLYLQRGDERIYTFLMSSLNFWVTFGEI